MNDDDKIDFPFKGRALHRKNMKLVKDDERSQSTINNDEHSPLTQRGLSVDTKMQMIEMAQIKYSKKIEALTTTSSLCNNHMQLLLTERIQVIDLAKIVCTEHGKLDKHWIEVMDLSKSANNVKKDMKDYF